MLHFQLLLFLRLLTASGLTGVLLNRFFLFEFLFQQIRTGALTNSP